MDSLDNIPGEEIILRFENTARITKMMGEEYLLETPPTYHRLLAANIEATKALKGRTLEAGEFTFTLEDVTDPENVQLVEKTTNTGEGRIVFSPLVYTEPLKDKYLYRIREEQGSLPHITYSDEEVLVEVKIARDDTTGEYQITLLYPQDTQFENRYVPPPPKTQAVSVHLNARKELQGRRLNAGEFHFVLRDAAGNIIDRQVNDEGGRVSFAGRNYSQPGTYVYTIEELPGQVANVAYDTSKYTVRVRVSQDGEKLYARETYLKDGSPRQEAVFENTYHLPPTGDRGLALPMMLGLATLAMAWLSKPRKGRQSP